MISVSLLSNWNTTKFDQNTWECTCKPYPTALFEPVKYRTSHKCSCNPHAKPYIYTLKQVTCQFIHHLLTIMITLRSTCAQHFINSCRWIILPFMGVQWLYSKAIRNSNSWYIIISEPAIITNFQATHLNSFHQSHTACRHNVVWIHRTHPTNSAAPSGIRTLVTKYELITFSYTM
jgi:hypothetical protein